MAPNEQAPADSKGVADTSNTIEVEKGKEEQKVKLNDLGIIEPFINEYAKKFAKKHRVGEDNFTIVLTTKFKGIMGLKRGPVVQIILLWPDAQPNINTLLDGAFRTIQRNKLVDGLAVESVIHIKRRAEDRKKLLREQIGNDESDIILDLIPKHRIRCTVTTTVQYEDVVTGEKISVTHKDKPEQFRGQDVSNWIKLSRIVRDNHPEEATRYVGEETSVLNPVLNSSSNARAVGGDERTSTSTGGQGGTESADGNDGEGHDVVDIHQIAS